MISVSVVQDIRRLRMEGESIASIARNAGVSEPTVRKYLRPLDMSPSLPAKEGRPSVMGRHANIVDGWLEENRGNWHKQRHTAKRIWQRLCEETRTSELFGRFAAHFGLDYVFCNPKCGA